MTARSHSRPRDCMEVANQDATGTSVPGRLVGNDAKPGDLPLTLVQRSGCAVEMWGTALHIASALPKAAFLPSTG